MANQSQVRVGLLGAGGITGAHLPAYAALGERVRVVAVADPRRDAAEARAKEAGGAEVFASWEELIARAPIDAVDICLPHHLHAPAALTAFERGLHVLTEKPIARTLDEADAMIAAAQKANRRLMICHNRRWIPAVARLKEMIAGGELGRLLALRLEKNGGPAFGRTGASLGWVAKKATLGGGAVVSDLIHELDLIGWLGGPAASVSGTMVTEPEWMEGEVMGVVSVHLENGAIADAAINWGARGTGQLPGLPHAMVRAVGTRATAVYVLGQGLSVAVEGEPGVKQVVPGAGGSGHDGAIAHFIDCIVHEREPLTNGAAGRAALQLAMGAYQAEMEGRRIPLPLTRPYFAAVGE